jgi:hypothetical protein
MSKTVQMTLTDTDMARVDFIKATLGPTSQTKAVRYSVSFLFDIISKLDQGKKVYVEDKSGYRTKLIIGEE